jgi:predicted dehydrogenase
VTAPFRLAFLGIDHPHGSGWRQLLPALEAEARLVAIVPGFEGALASLEERYARLPRWRTVEELLDWGKFDGAIVCLPNDEAPKVIERLARAGRHVLAEKPVAATAADFQPVAEAIRETGVAFQTGYLWRYDPAAERLREMAAAGRFGRLISVEMSWFTSDVAHRGASHYLFDPRRSGRGFFNWLGCHWIDLLMFVIDRPVLAVTSRVGQFAATPVAVEDGGTAILELDGGALVTMTGGYWLPRWVNELRWAFRGSERWVHWEPSVPGTGGVLRIHGPQPQFLAMDERFEIPEDQTPGYGGARGLRLIRDWIAEARTGRPVCRNTVDTTRVTLELLDEIDQSSREGRRLDCWVEPAPLPPIAQDEPS